MTSPFARVLGRSGIEVSALGCWTLNGSPAAWSTVDDAEPLRALGSWRRWWRQARSVRMSVAEIDHFLAASGA